MPYRTITTVTDIRTTDAGASKTTHMRAPIYILLLLLSMPALAVEGGQQELEGVDVDEQLGDVLPLQLEFVDHEGTAVALGDYFRDGVPVILTMNYFRCPMLCGLQLNGLTSALSELEWTPGERFRLVTVSINPEEGPELAAAKRANHLEMLGRGEDVDWAFLTGDAEAIDQLAEAIGYQYRYVASTGEYAHPAALTFVSPEGVITRYLNGLSYEAFDMRMALLEASEGRIGSPVDQIFLGCFIYDPVTGGYVRNAWMFMRIGGALTVLVLGTFLGVLWLRERRRDSQHPVHG